MKLNEMRSILVAEQIQLTKSLGQNFLHDANQLSRIVDAGQVGSKDRILEIGPGLGPLTELLLERSGEVLAIEKDQRLVRFLEKRFVQAKNFKLLHADAFVWLKSEARDWTGWKLVANLPYSVASPILVELSEAEQPPDRMVATLQHEVVQRIVARPGTSQYGLLSLLLQLEYRDEGSFKIPAGSFFPPPDVDSACVTLLRRSETLLTGTQRALYKALVKKSFSERRKMMLKLLKSEHNESALRSAFQVSGIPETARAETVSMEQFVSLTKQLSNHE
ncbi:MAG: 16S rRNA (adenine(1518)-N(6)/adenine(1519)-N(6))-dimethyltransferase RsmA [Verrucomicrobiota bacterium]|nr:16S rRNA (adenine(1518)-N(6)/adenine(1519)-N(6))-dimethyltransferase RsmA [Verrucomicrobiota bacterium]